MSSLNWTPSDSPIPGARAWLKGSLRVLIARENGRLHLSISCKDRYPTWDEIAGARYDLLPADLYFAMVLPPAENYMNLHPFCFHLWEMEDDAMPCQRHDTGTPRTEESRAGT